MSSADHATIVDPAGKEAPAPDLPPPNMRSGPVMWLRANFFSSPLDIGLTLLAVYLIVTYLPPFLDWAIFNATFVGTSRQDCNPDGACWVFIWVRFDQFMYGFYPEAEQWRVNLTGLILAGLGTLLLLPRVPRKPWIAAFTLFGFPIIAYVLLVGGVFGLEYIETSRWGGLFLTVVVAVCGIVIALVWGVVLALGRRSKLPIIRYLSTAYIEFIRAVPLITILFMASVMLPLFLPEGWNLAKAVRAIVGTALFWSAYMAESVRGGLQAVPRGQYEAADAIGLNYWKSMVLIILPQGLKFAIPGIVNTIISLVKDTTLLLLVGIFDLLGIVQAAAANPQWLGNYVEGYVFVALIFWTFCFGMSFYSRRLERRLHTGH